MGIGVADDRRLAMLIHGGDLEMVSRYFDRPVAEWLDLSTGINPLGYPPEEIPAQIYRNLPSAVLATLQTVASEYFAADNVVLAAGTQQIIQHLPNLFTQGRVAVPDCGYSEHALSWQQAGHSLVFYDGFNPQTVEELIDNNAIEHAVVINPNNPTAAFVPVSDLLKWREKLAAKGGCLVVDEAFIDVYLDENFADVGENKQENKQCDKKARNKVGSMVPYSAEPGLLVMRSMGKFWGLAGARVGFALCSAAFANVLRERLGPWPIAGPSAFVAHQALQAQTWQRDARRQLCSQQLALQSLWRDYFPAWQQFSTPLFVTLKAPAVVSARAADTKYAAETESVSVNNTQALWHQLARRGILLRRWNEHPDMLRCGLPGARGSESWLRFEAALRECSLLLENKMLSMGV